MPDVNGVAVALTAILSALGGWLAQRAAARRDQAEATVNLQTVLDARIKDFLTRQEAALAAQEEEIEDLRRETRALRALFEEVRRLARQLVDELRRHDTTAADGFEAALDRLKDSGERVHRP